MPRMLHVILSHLVIGLGAFLVGQYFESYKLGLGAWLMASGVAFIVQMGRADDGDKPKSWHE